MFDLFFTLGAIWFGVEILHKAWDVYMIISLRLAIRRHDEYCEDCAEQELIKEIRKK